MAGMSNIEKYGEWVEKDGKKYLLTNLRALLEDVGEEESLKYFNTSEEEIQIIRDNFKVFLFNVDLSTRAQMVRHRVSWQELSRRYVSYIADTTGIADNLMELSFSTEDIINVCLNHYFKAIASGVKPEEARRILPQAMMTQIWGAFQPSQLDNWFKLRLNPHAQSEIRMVAQAMQELINTGETI